MKILKYEEIDQELLKETDSPDMEQVRRIIAEVKEKGDRAIKDYTRRFDGVSLDTLKIEKPAFAEAKAQMPRDTVAALQRAADNIGTFARRQLEHMQDFEFETAPGVMTGQRVVPIERAGVYVPGGNFPLVSSLLMGVVPARTAGVKEIAVCTPPGPGGSIHPAILAAAALTGVDELYTIGGIQAVAALAYGSESIRPVDKIVGPGNRYVTAAKKEVYGDVGIDFIAGPSELLVIADESADPAWIAADLLAQAEHDVQAVPLLVTPAKKLGRAVNAEIDRQLPLLASSDIAAASIEKNGSIILVEDLDQAVEFANRKAPEHLELHLRQAQSFSKKCRNYGSLFIGKQAAEVLGDYSSGINHTLPTARAARYTGGLSVLNFVKVLTTLRVMEGPGIDPGDTRSDARLMAQLEGLCAHANAITIRE